MEKYKIVLQSLKDHLEVIVFISALVSAPFIWLEYDRGREEADTDRSLRIIENFAPALEYGQLITELDDGRLNTVIGVTNPFEYPIHVAGLMSYLVSCETSQFGPISSNPVEITVGSFSVGRILLGFRPNENISDGRYIVILDYSASSPMADAFMQEYQLEIRPFSTQSATQASDIGPAALPAAPQIQDAVDGLRYLNRLMVAIEISDGTLTSAVGNGCNDAAIPKILSNYD